MSTPSSNPSGPRINPLAVAIGGGVAMAAYMGLGRFVYTPILPVMVEDFGLSKSQAGFIASSNFLGYLIGALVGATSFVSGSRRAWVLWMLALSALTTGALGMTSSVAILSVLRFLGGLASAIGFVFLTGLVFDRTAQAGRTDLAPIQFVGVGIGIASSALLVSVMITQGAGPFWLWLACGAAAVVALAAVALLIPRGDETPFVPSALGAGAATINSSIVRIVIAYGLYGFGYVITVTFLIAIVRATPAFAPLEFWVWIVVGLAAAPSISFWNAMAKRIGPKRAYAVACVAEAIGVASSVLWNAPAGVIVAAILLGGTFVGLTPLGIAAVRQHLSGDPRKLVAGMTASFSLGQIIGPIFAGWLFDRMGSFVPSTLAAAGALLLAAVLMLSVPAAAKR